jgi:hypothetical protein
MSARASALALTYAMLVATPVFALDVITLEPVADTVIYFGGDSTAGASNGIGENLSVGQTADGTVRRSLIRFDLSGLAPGSVVHSAQLTLFEPRSRGNYDVGLHRLLRGWGEGTSNGGSAGGTGTATPGDATWEKARHPDIAWTTPGGDYIAHASAVTFVGFPGTTYSWSSAGMIVDVQRWIDGSEANHGWILIGNETTNQNAKLFGSRESGAPPSLMLQISPVPEPTTLVMMVVGAGLVGWRLLGRKQQVDRRKLTYA